MTTVYTGADGLRLAADVHEGSRPTPVVLLHGGGQTRHAWGRTATTLAEHGWTAVAVDLRGHGESDWSPSGDYGADAYAADVRAIARAQPAPPILVGASLGGMSSLLAAGEAPGVPVAGIVLVDVAHRFNTSGAKRIVDFMTADPAGFASPADAIAAVARYLPHRPPPDDPDGILRNLRERDGRWHWHWDPQITVAGREITGGATTLQRRLEAALASLDVPVMLVRGTISEIVTPAIAEEFLALAPRGRVLEVAKAGHMVAGDRNDHFTDGVLRFLESA